MSQPAAPALRAIDTHHHIYPPNYTRENLQRIVDDIGVAPASLYLNWSPASALEKMDQAGVEMAINSITSPGVWFNDGEAGRVRARECNEYGARLMQDHPRRFGLFATLPLPDIEGSLREIGFAYDQLKADGITLLTSYAGRFLGDAAFAPVFEELDRRAAVVFVHPTMSCCGSGMPGVAAPVIDFPMDSTRTIVSLLLSGGFTRYQRICFVFSHGGGMLLPVMNRVIGTATRARSPGTAGRAPQEVLLELQRQYYDLASIGANGPGFEGLRKMMPATQLLYGTDEPLNSALPISRGLLGAGLSLEEVQLIARGNATRLFPRLAG